MIVGFITCIVLAAIISFMGYQIHIKKETVAYCRLSRRKFYWR